MLGMLGCNWFVGPDTFEHDHPVTAPDFEGTWHATLTSRGGDLPFSLRLLSQDGNLTAAVHNGPTAVPFSSVTVDGRHIVLRVDPHDSEIRASMDDSDQSLLGAWTKRTAAGPVRMPFSAAPGQRSRFVAPNDPTADGAPTSVDGDWSIALRAEDGGTRSGTARFASTDGVLLGALLFEDLEHRDLEGHYTHGTLELSFFDGNEALLLRATAQNEDNLRGELWSGATDHADWTATRLAR